MHPDSVYGAGANPGAAREGAGNGTACVESSRFAAPSLRYGPSGDTTPPVPKKFPMAVSELPAMDDRRVHALGPLPPGTDVATDITAHHRRSPIPSPDSEDSNTAIPFVGDSRNSHRQAHRRPL